MRWPLHYGPSLGHTLVRAGEWSVVRRFVDRLPFPLIVFLLVVLVIAATFQFVWRAEKRRIRRLDRESSKRERVGRW